jgi:hypothetical protein
MTPLRDIWVGDPADDECAGGAGQVRALEGQVQAASREISERQASYT